MSGRGPTLSDRVSALEASVTALKDAHGIELRDLKAEIDDLQKEIRALTEALAQARIETAPLLKASARFVEIVSEVDETRGRDKLLGKIFAGGGIFGAIGAAVYGFWEFLLRGAA